jgi:hypothetical protein
MESYADCTEFRKGKLDKILLTRLQLCDTDAVREPTLTISRFATLSVSRVFAYSVVRIVPTVERFGVIYGAKVNTILSISSKEWTAIRGEGA